MIPTHPPQDLWRATCLVLVLLLLGPTWTAWAQEPARSPAEIYNEACHAAQDGRIDEAFGLLGRVVDQGFANPEHLRQDPDLAGLREDPRWSGLVERSAALAEQHRKLWDSPAWKTPYRPDLSPAEKVAGLSRLWAEVKYNFANFDLVPDVDWDALYLETLPRVQATTSTLEYYRVLMELAARLRDGHTNVYPPRELRDAVYALPALRTRLVEDRVLVVEVLDPELEADGLTPGLEIVAIDGAPVHDYAESRVRPYQSASTSQDLDVRTYDYMLLAGAAGTVVELTLGDPDGTTSIRPVPRLDREVRDALTPDTEPVEIAMLPGNVAHVKLRTFGTDETADRFDQALPELRRAAAWILDLRDNGGGSSSVGWRILGHLTDRPFPTSSWRTRQYRPAFRAWGFAEGRYEEQDNVWESVDPEPYSKPVAVLTGPRTFSAAEDFAVSFDVMDRGLLVGEATGGSTGQPLFFTLPGGGSARVCTKRDTYPDGRDWVGRGIQPDVLVRPGVEDVRAGRDVVLERALELVQGKDMQGGSTPSHGLPQPSHASNAALRVRPQR